MTQIELHLIPAPGAKPEFLSTIEQSTTSRASESYLQLPPKIVLEGYTRDVWATKPDKDCFTTVIVKSVDGRRKLPGFLKYLKDRQKAAYGRFVCPNQQQEKGVWTIGHVQPPSKNEDETIMMCRYSLDLSQIPNCPFNKGVAQKPQQQQQRPQQSKPTPKQQPVAAAPTNSKLGGMLGSLLGAQQRTNEHLDAFPQKKPKSAPSAASAATSSSEQLLGSSTNGTKKSNDTPAASATMTGQEVLAQFRQEMEERLLDFDTTSETVLKVPISLAKMSRNLSQEEEKAKVTMEVLKYIVYEQADEINEEWVAYKEPSEFMDEIVIAIYKEGHAPPEVLEDLNKGDLPDEVRGTQRAAQEAMRKHVVKKEAKAEQQRQSQAMKQADEEDLEVLNVMKRDRRSIEEIQRDMGQDNTKRMKT